MEADVDHRDCQEAGGVNYAPAAGKNANHIISVAGRCAGRAHGNRFKPEALAALVHHGGGSGSADAGDANRAIDLLEELSEIVYFFAGGQTYPGGASRLHLLRFVLGDEAFFAGIRGYVAANAG